ncbi:hypothetical protein [Streptococcus plurextorum]|uniref:hypothetical protein n=1 Tax=Streptococcus plurextorum TaxID=456876 RepID=UPI00041911F8|nr:hypothetical protein [Streptococcus plurextorum]
MLITVKRRTKVIRAFAPIYIKSTHRTLAKIWEKEEVDLDLLTEETVIYIRGSKKSSSKVADGDTVIIKDNPHNALAFWSGIAIIVFGQFIFPPGTWTMAILTWIGLLSILSSLFIPRFILEKE